MHLGRQRANSRVIRLKKQPLDRYELLNCRKLIRDSSIVFDKYKEMACPGAIPRGLIFEQLGDDGLCDSILKYGGFRDLKIGLDVFGLKRMKRVWLW